MRRLHGVLARRDRSQSYRQQISRLAGAAGLALVISASLVVLSFAAAASSLYAINEKGELLYFVNKESQGGTDHFPVANKVIGTSFDQFKTVLAGNEGAIYAITRDGRMLFYRFTGITDGANTWEVVGKEIGTGWDAYTLVFGGFNGDIYAILPDGQMMFYKYAGIRDGSAQWQVERKPIDTGWTIIRGFGAGDGEFNLVFGGHNGAIYATDRNDRLVFYRFAGAADGSNNWAVKGKFIGPNIRNYKAFAAGEDGAIYAIHPDNQLRFFRYQGIADGSDRWVDINGKIIGAGWPFSHGRLLAGGNVNLQTVIKPKLDPKPGPATKPPPLNTACDAFAKTALDDRRIGLNWQPCVSEIRGPRWDASYQVHYDWCLKASNDLRTSRMKERKNVLALCGAGGGKPVLTDHNQ